MAQDKDTNIDVDVNIDDDSLYYEDEAVYAFYSETEAEEIINPVEFVEESTVCETELDNQAENTIQKKKKQFDLNEAIGNFFEFIYLIGEEAVEIFRWLIKKCSVLLIPIFIAVNKAKTICKNIFNGLKNRQSFSFEIQKIKEDFRLIKEHSDENQDKNDTSQSEMTKKGFLLSLFKQKEFYRKIGNCLFPVAAAVILLVVAFNIRGNSTYALEVIYKNKSIGYIENQDTFNEAKTEALTLISTGAKVSDSSEPIGEPTYKIKRVSVNLLCNSDMISEELLKNSDVTYTHACGIYIDGEFLCAVRNESDAVAVFDKILSPYEAKAGRGTTVGFVEEISYVQGFYDSESGVIWDSITLRNKLNNPKTTAKYHKVASGETAKTIAKENGITISKLKSLNPNISINKLKKGTKLLVCEESHYVRVKVMKTKTRTEKIAYDTVKKNSSSLTKGTTKISQNGKTGTRTITELVTYINGQVSYTSLISSKQTKAPTDKIILVGTKETVYTTSSGATVYSSNDTSGFIWPTYGAYSISSGFGYRSLRGYYSYHGGIDIVKGSGGSAGTPVIAAAAGTVVIAQSGYTGYGYTVLIDHGNGIRTRYGHMLAGSICVSYGQHVSRGQQIGQIGSTGNSTGPHLHFEVLVNGNKVNPLSYIG